MRLLTHAIVVLEIQLAAHLLRMALVAPPVVGITQGVAQVYGMFPIEHIEIVEMSVMAELADARRGGGQSEMAANGVVSLARTSRCYLFGRQSLRNLRQVHAIEMIHVVLEIHAAVQLKAIEPARRQVDVEGVVHIARRRIVFHLDPRRVVFYAHAEAQGLGEHGVVLV